VPEAVRNIIENVACRLAERWQGRITPPHLLCHTCPGVSMWPRGAVAHYSRTQLKGTVYIEGQAYVAYIADAGENDTDLTNDGISVDVNGDGEINRQQEFFPPGQVAHIHGKEYVFVITW
jgi:hypothetical protein